MKIGVALSGCDIGGVCAASVLHWLRQQGILIDLISTSGTASPAALLFCCGLEPHRCNSYMEAFLQERIQMDLDNAIASLSARLSPEQACQATGLAVNAVDLGANKAVTFSNDFAFETGTLSTFPLTGPYEALSATIGTVDGLCSFPYKSYKLCDYCVQYGCPFFPLHLAGCERILSFSFIPQVPSCPYDVLINRRINETSIDANFHLSFPFPLSESGNDQLETYNNFALNLLDGCKIKILQSALF